MGATITSAFDLDIPAIELDDATDRAASTAKLRAAAEQSWIARNMFGFSILRYDDVVAMLRDKRWHSATSRIMEMSGITDPRVPGTPAHVDPVGGG